MKFSYETVNAFHRDLLKERSLKPGAVIVRDMPNIGFSIESKDRTALHAFEKRFQFVGSNVTKPKKINETYIMIGKNFPYFKR